jgi:ketosteroid isomerase-like protein
MSQVNKAIVEKVNASFAEGNMEGFLSFCAEDVKWTMVGEKSVRGKGSIREWMSSMGDSEPPKFTVDNIVSEGDVVVANGEMTMKDKDGNTGSYSYCDFYRFTDGRISELISYVVKTEPANNTQEASA